MKQNAAACSQNECCHTKQNRKRKRKRKKEKEKKKEKETSELVGEKHLKGINNWISRSKKLSKREKERERERERERGCVDE